MEEEERHKERKRERKKHVLIESEPVLQEPVKKNCKSRKRQGNEDRPTTQRVTAKTHLRKKTCWRACIRES